MGNADVRRQRKLSNAYQCFREAGARGANEATMARLKSDIDRITESILLAQAKQTQLAQPDHSEAGKAPPAKKEHATPRQSQSSRTTCAICGLAVQVKRASVYEGKHVHYRCQPYAITQPRGGGFACLGRSSHDAWLYDTRGDIYRINQDSPWDGN